MLFSVFFFHSSISFSKFQPKKLQSIESSTKKKLLILFNKILSQTPGNTSGNCTPHRTFHRYFSTPPATRLNRYTSGAHPGSPEMKSATLCTFRGGKFQMLFRTWREGCFPLMHRSPVPKTTLAFWPLFLVWFQSITVEV